MKKTLIVLASALLLASSAFAQDAKPTFKWYGFIRNYYAFDTRESVSGTEDFFYYVPKDVAMKGDIDANEVSTFRFAAITSRLGVDVTGYEFKDWKIGAKIEGDFYSGVSGVTGTATFRLRQAFLTMAKGNYTLKAGQAWHPMAADMPDVFSLNTGAPFGPFSRTPLIQAERKLSDNWTLTDAIIWQMQYVSAGPDGASANYMKYGMIPEIYLGLNRKFDGGLARLGVDVLSISPSHGIVDGAMHKNRITTYSPFLYLQYASGPFSVKFKTIYAQAGEHMNLNGGYGVAMKHDNGSITYTPTVNSSSWVSLQYKKDDMQYILFGGFVKNLGTVRSLESDGDYYKDARGTFSEDVNTHSSLLYFSKNSFSNMNAMWRLTPTVIKNIGKVAIGLELELTSIQYGDYYKYKWEGTTYSCVNAKNGLATENLHWVTNTRVQGMLKYTF